MVAGEKKHNIMLEISVVETACNCNFHSIDSFFFVPPPNMKLRKFNERIIVRKSLKLRTKLYRVFAIISTALAPPVPAFIIDIPRILLESTHITATSILQFRLYIASLLVISAIFF